MAVKSADFKKRRILEAARGLLVKRGFQDIVLDDVARAAGVAKGTLFLYYKDKNELFSAAFGDLVDQLGEALEGLHGGGLKGRALLEATVGTILAHLERNRDFMSQFSAGRFPGCRDSSSGKLIERMAQNMRRLSRLLERCYHGGLGRLKDPEYAAVSLFGLCRSAMLSQIFRGVEVSLEKDVDTVVGFFLHGAGGRR